MPPVSMGCVSVEPSREVKHALGEAMSRQTILDAETPALIVAVALSKKKLQGRPAILYVDNNFARETLVSVITRSPVSPKAPGVFLTVEDRGTHPPWIARAPSHQILQIYHSVNSKK